MMEPDGERLILLYVEESPGHEWETKGFLVAHHVAAEWELENIVVSAKSRQKGIGGHLLEALFSRARETNSEELFLEVRESNTAARSFYERHGFQQVGSRKSYYNAPSEDAILYRRKVR